MSKWIKKTWNGLTNFNPDYIWTDGTDIYYSDNNSQYVLDKATSTWVEKTWNGLTSFMGKQVWTDGTDMYYSVDSFHFVLDKSTSTWVDKTWKGFTGFVGSEIWTDGTDVYSSRGSYQYVLDKSTSTWIKKTWNGLTSFGASSIWTDGTNIYYSYPGDTHCVLDKSTSTWTPITWNINIAGIKIWTDGTDIYYSNDSEQYVLNKSTSTWIPKTWEGLTNFSGNDIWTDGTNIYYNRKYYADEYYVLYIPPVIHATKLPYATIDTFKMFHSEMTRYIKNQNVLSSIETVSLSNTSVTMQYDGIINGIGTVTVNGTTVATNSAFSIPFNKGDVIAGTGNVSTVTVRYYKLRDYTGGK